MGNLKGNNQTVNIKDLDKQLEEAVIRHLQSMKLKEVQKIFNQNLDYDDVASEYVYSTGLNEKGYHSVNDYGDLDKDKDWLIEQLVEASMNDYDGCATLGELACQLEVDASNLSPMDNFYNEKIDELFDEPMDREIARILIKEDQENLVSHLDRGIERAELYEWHEPKLDKDTIENLIKTDRLWLVEQVVLHCYFLREAYSIEPTRRYLTVEIWGYDLDHTGVGVRAKYDDMTTFIDDTIPSDIVGMADENGYKLW